MEWFADERLWQAFYPFLFPDEKLAAGADEVDRILALTSLKGGSVLDLCCGPGRHAVALARAGFSVTGVDRSRFLLDRAAEHAGRQQASVEWVLEDMRAFVRPDSFDLALSLYTSFGYFEADADNRAVLVNVCHSLRPHGSLVVDLAGKEIVARIFQPARADARAGAGKHFVQARFLPGLSKIENEWTLVPESGPVERFRFQHWIYSARELELMLLDAGFDRVSVFGGLAGEPYDLGASRLVAVATRS